MGSKTKGLCTLCIVLLKRPWGSRSAHVIMVVCRALHLVPIGSTHQMGTHGHQMQGLGSVTWILKYAIPNFPWQLNITNVDRPTCRFADDNSWAKCNSVDHYKMILLMIGIQNVLRPHHMLSSHLKSTYHKCSLPTSWWKRDDPLKSFKTQFMRWERLKKAASLWIIGEQYEFEKKTRLCWWDEHVLLHWHYTYFCIILLYYNIHVDIV